jgi:RimJ/RimL family protein N-acetyltransferase
VLHTGRVDRSPWPLFGLRVVTPRVVLRYPDDDDAFALAALAAGGVHDPSTMPFLVPWTDAEPKDLVRGTVQWVWRQRAEWTATRWHLPLAVVVDHEVVGVQSLEATDFATMREVGTGSWLGRRHQGQGIGKEMRAAALHLAFAGLDAVYANSGAFHDNHASIGVSRALGYEEAGRRRALRRDRPDWVIGFRLTRERWEQGRRDDIRLEGLEPCLELFGAR